MSLLQLLPKILVQLVYPLSFFLGITILAGILSIRTRKVVGCILLVSAGLLWLLSTVAFSSFMLSSLERSFPPVPVKESPRADAIVVLGPGAAPAEKPRFEVELIDPSDRILHAVRLYKAGKAPVVMTTGGIIAWLGQEIPEADSMSILLQEWGVPPGAIVMESASTNTYENAIHIRDRIKGMGFKKILLVTSAMHMPRALATFRSAGIDAVPSPTDYRVADFEDYHVMDFLPNAGALADTTVAIKEYLGIWVYRLRGWIK